MLPKHKSLVNLCFPDFTVYEGEIMKVKVIYRKNLKMSTGKIAAQAVHAVVGLGVTDYYASVVVLGVSDKKFRELTNNDKCFVVKDIGKTEVDAGTLTCAAFYEDE